MKRRSLLKAALATAAAPLAAPALAQPVPTLRFIPQANLTALDPVWTTATVTFNHAYYVFDVLYATDSKGAHRPQMAEGHTVSDDGRTWRFPLRAGLFFHDGEPVRAQDCAASLARWAKRDPFGQILEKSVESWGAADDRTVEIKLKRPFPLLLAAIAKAEGPPFIMPERLAKTDANTAVREVVGSGPFRFVADEYNSGSRVVYAKFDRYVPRQEAPDGTAGGKMAHFGRVVWNVIADPSTAGAALQNNEADWWERPLVDLIPTLLRNPAIRAEVTDPAGRLALCRPNCLQPPMNDVKLRRAVLASVRQEDFMRASRGDDEKLWTTSRSLFPRNTPYYQDHADLMPGDLSRAAAMLKEAGYAGQKLVIINPTDFPDIGPLGLVMNDALKKLGVNVELRESDWGTVIQRRASREPIEKGGWSLFHTTGPAPTYGSPVTSPLVRGQGERGWFGWWGNARAEELAEAWVEASDPAQQAKLAQELGRLALSEVATIPVGQFYLQTAYRTSLKDMVKGLAPFPWGVKPG
jgi:peptide/nickel transport system substrate-binding protein